MKGEAVVTGDCDIHETVVTGEMTVTVEAIVTGETVVTSYIDETAVRKL